MAGEANIISKVSIARVKSIVASVMGGISEAPIDGQQYARQNAAWSVVSGGGGEFWSRNNGGALTGNNTISGAFNIGFTNNAVGFGVAPASINANTRVDIRGYGTDSSTAALRIADSNNAALFRVLDDGQAIFGFQTSTSTGRTKIENFDVNAKISRTGTAGTLIISSDNSETSALITYGSSHATKPGRLELKSSNFSHFQTGSVLIGGSNITTSAVLDVQSTTRAVILPRMTTTQRDAIPTPSAGMLIYNTSTNVYNFHNGTTWDPI